MSKRYFTGEVLVRQTTEDMRLHSGNLDAETGILSLYLANAEGEIDVSPVTVDLSEIQAADKVFPTLAALLAEPGTLEEGQIVTAGGFRYEVAASGATDHHLTTSGGVKLYVLLKGLKQISAAAFGITAVTTDQFEALNAAIQACSTAKCALDITGFDIRIATQSNQNASYADVSGTGRYAILIPSDGFMKIVGDGRIQNLSADSNQVMFFGIDPLYVEIGDGVEMDANATTRGFAACLGLYGVTHFHEGNCKYTRDGSLRVGASAAKQSQLWTYDSPRHEDGFGTFAAGCKPGGCAEIIGKSRTFLRTCGGMNVESEDVNGFGNASNIVADVGYLYGTDIDATKGGTLSGEVSLLVVQDTEFGVVHCSGMNGNTFTSSTGNAQMVKVGGGQSDNPPSHVSIGPIHAVGVATVLFYNPTERGGEKIHIGPVTGTRIERILKARPAPLTNTPEGAKEIRFESVNVNLLSDQLSGNPGVAFDVLNSDVTHSGDIIERLVVQEFYADEIKNCAAYIEDVTLMEIGRMEWGDVSTFRSSQPYGSRAFWFAGGTLRVKDALISNNSYDTAFYLAPTTLADIRGLKVVTNDAGAGILLSGSGTVILREGEVVSSTSFGISHNTWAGTLELRGFNLNGNGISTGASPDLIRDSDFLNGEITSWGPGAISFGTPVTQTATITGAALGDTFTIAPLTTPGGGSHRYSYKAIFTSANTVTMSLFNNDNSIEANPGSVTWKLRGERG